MTGAPASDDPLAPVSTALTERGWAIFPGYLDAATLASLDRDTRALLAKPGQHDAAHYFFERPDSGSPRLVRIERISEHLAAMQGDLGARLRQDAARLLGGPVVLFKDKVNIRDPGSPGYAPHQDAARWDRFSDRFLSIGLFLCASDPGRGGFEFAAFDPALGRLATPTGDLNAAGFDALPRTGLTAAAGDALFIDGYAPHRTTDNSAPETVIHLLFTFAKSEDTTLRDQYYASQARDFDRVREGNRFVFAQRR